jgi:hypothetical protein
MSDCVVVTLLTYQWGAVLLFELQPHIFTIHHTYTPYPFTPTLPHPFTDIDSQLEHTSHLLGQLQDEQTDRLSQAPLELDDGHLTLPGPSDEEVRIASDLRAGLAQLTAQVLYVVLYTRMYPLPPSVFSNFVNIAWKFQSIR